MKHLRKILIAALAVAMLAVAAVGFAACGGTDKTVKETYVCGELADNGYGGHDSSVYQLNLMSDGSYELIKTTLIYGYSMNLGTTTVEIFGTYTEGTETDGYIAYTLSDATRVILNSYSNAGGYNINIDTDTSTYPLELPASGEGEKVMANGKEDVVNAYGKGMTVYASASNNTTFSLTNPNA